MVDTTSTPLPVCVLFFFIYYSSKVIQLKNTKEVIVREIVFAIPYFILPYLVALIVTAAVPKLILVLFCAFIWFVLVHFYFVKTSAFKILITDLFISRIKK